MAKYSQKTLIAAEKFLAGYQLALNALDESQKTVILYYVDRRRHAISFLFVAIFAIVTFVPLSFMHYRGAHAKIEDVSKNSPSVKLSDGHQSMSIAEFGGKCVDKGATIVLSVFNALIWVFFTVSSFSFFHSRKKVLNAFLPAIKKLNTSEQLSDV